jgi:anthranilate synthase/aminodeoxychorismate synthase-like glutamine amidotransferase
VKILLIDNYDSFTWNLVHYLQIAGAEVTILRNDELSVKEAADIETDGVVFSPGPRQPSEAGNLMSLVAYFVDSKPVLGVCLGHQAIAMHFGWELKLAANPMHGKSCEITHNGKGIFEGLAQPLTVGRYHSLVVESNQGVLKETAMSNEEVMAFQHISKPIFGVQFHPESILTPEGQKLIQNWVNLVAMFTALAMSIGLYPHIL